LTLRPRHLHALKPNSRAILEGEKVKVDFLVTLPLEPHKDRHEILSKSLLASRGPRVSDGKDLIDANPIDRDWLVPGPIHLDLGLIPRPAQAIEGAGLLVNILGNKRSKVPDRAWRMRPERERGQQSYRQESRGTHSSHLIGVAFELTTESGSGTSCPCASGLILILAAPRTQWTHA